MDVGGTTRSPGSPLDYGPIPMSRLKHEANAVYQALQEGRRVLISRHGAVVAAIDPVSLDRHVRELARFALPSEGDELPHLTARELMQGSPSDFVRRAEEGSPSLVTRANKVYGVLTSDVPAENAQSVDKREDALAYFERQHPDASAEDFAAESARLASAEPSPPLTPDLLGSRAGLELGNLPEGAIVVAFQESVIEALKDQRNLDRDALRVVGPPNASGGGATVGSEWVPVAPVVDVRPGRVWAYGGAVAVPDMSTDAYFQSGYLVVEIDLAGIDSDSIDVQLEGSALTVRAEREMPREVSRWLIHERTRGPLTRRITLEEEVDPDAVEAKYEDGVLRVVITASEPTDDARKIPVQRGSLSEPAGVSCSTPNP